MVADAVEGLDAEVERGEDDVGAPHGVVVAAGHERCEGILRRVTTGAVAAVVAERDRLGEGDVEPDRRGDGGGHLGDLERMGEPGALVVFGEDEHLRLAGQPAERGGAVQDAVAVALETRAQGVGRLGHGPIARPTGEGGAGAHRVVLGGLASHAIVRGPDRDLGMAVGVGMTDRRIGAAVTRHRGGPLLGAAGALERLLAEGCEYF